MTKYEIKRNFEIFLQASNHINVIVTLLRVLQDCLETFCNSHRWEMGMFRSKQFLFILCLFLKEVLVFTELNQLEWLAHYVTFRIWPYTALSENDIVLPWLCLSRYGECTLRKRVESKRLLPWSRFMARNSAPLVAVFWCHFERWSCFGLQKLGMVPQVLLKCCTW